ncbi:cytochrome C oxidase subunit IV family protein [Pusillimonas noertemannii]|uniref:Cytochrome c oxidase subunit 4 n=1 Tax=Pusillimonas noertemannii TaxID=305977 RepID=A0A2U1CK08_9BURK|nr:cytochrome C oxidase subunit IV family protein [Pusillimonas noertemannii]NYT69726.1 cytochrome C oxidase subunit IV family protein [Pusillimonas noertemannii]PVY61350.1 cytochrome c oxidase subunit 4 [Pusillimonas noertemannii]TFL09038.1 Caa(3)-type oxidase subunit IV [Pusillimonas noertemannii]
MKTLILTWFALMVLLCITAFGSLLPLGPANAILNAAIAVAKAVLVAMFFMHLRHGIALIRIAAVVALVMLSLLFILSGADFLTRHIQHSAWQGRGSDLSTESVRKPVNNY